MKHVYNTPYAEVLMLANEDVITTSLTSEASGIGNKNTIDCSGWLNG